MAIQPLEGYAHWTVNEYVDPETGEVVRNYFYKRVPAKRIPLRDKKSQQLAGYLLIEKDLRNIKSWIEEITSAFEDTRHVWEKIVGFQRSPDRKRFQVVKGLFVAAVTTYGKCFSECKGRRIKLERAFVEDLLQGEHDSIIKARNNFAAHSGEARMEKAEVCLVLDTKRGGRTSPLIMRELDQPDTYSLDDIQRFASLVDDVHKKVLRKVDELFSSINEDCKELGYQYWLEL